MTMRWSSWIRPIRKVRTRESQEVLQRLQLFLESDDVIKTPVRILTRFWEDQQHAIGYSELRQIVQDGTVSPEALQLWSQDYSVLVANQFYSVWMDAVKAGAARQLLLDDVPFTFRTQTKGILNWIRDRGAEFVTACTEEQKQAIATLLTKSIRDHHTVEELSQMIRPCIGLTKEQAKANFRYYHTIATNLRNEHPRMKAESIQRKAQEAAQKYAERQHRQRAMTIAQTESAFAYNYGADESIRQAQAQHLLGEVKKRWCTSGDDAVCEVCASLDGIELELDADFQMKGKPLFRGQHLLPPAHPRCACAVEYIEIDAPATIGTEWREFPNVNDIMTQDYKEVVLDEEIREFQRAKELGTIEAKRVISSRTEMYVSNHITLSRKERHIIDTSIIQAANVLHIKDIGVLPMIVILDDTEMKAGVLASYTPYYNVLYINRLIANKDVLIGIQEGLAANKNKIATYVHELIHWLDAEQYRKKFGEIDEYYTDWLNKKCKKAIDKLEKQGYNVKEVSTYAEKQFKFGKYFETYTEYRTKQALKE